MRGLYDNGVLSIRDGIMDFEQHRDNSGLRNTFSGLLLLYKYHLSTYDPELIYQKRQVSSSERRGRTNRKERLVTINFDGIIKRFGSVNEGEYFDKLFYFEEFKTREEIETEVEQIISKHLQSGKLKARNSAGHIARNPKHPENRGVLRYLVDRKYDGHERVSFLLRLEGKEKMINILRGLQETRNIIEHEFLSETAKLKIPAYIYKLKLVVWDFINNYLDESAMEVFERDTFNIFTKFENLREQVIEESEKKIKEHAQKKKPEYNITDVKCICPDCHTAMIYNEKTNEVLCLDCEYKKDIDTYLDNVYLKGMLFKSNLVLDEVTGEEYRLICPECGEELIVNKDGSISESDLKCTGCGEEYTLKEFLTKTDEEIAICSECGKAHYGDAEEVCVECYGKR